MPPGARVMADTTIISTVTPRLAAGLERALIRVINTSFECGEWDRNESDEQYDVVRERARKAERRLRVLIARFPLARSKRPAR